MYASDESSPIQALPSQTSDLMRAQGCCEGFCDDQNIAGRNNPDVRSDLSKQEARKRPQRALLGTTLLIAKGSDLQDPHSWTST